MAIYSLKNASIYNGLFNHSSETNRVSLNVDIENKNATALNDSWQKNMPGKTRIDLNLEGFYNTDGHSEPYFMNEIAQLNIPISIYGEGALGNLYAKGYGFLASQSTFKPVLNTGELAVFTIDAVGSGSALVRLTPIGEPLVQGRTGSGSGTIYNIGACATGKSIHSFLHVLSVTGTNPSMALSVWSSPNGTYGTATRRLIHTTMGSPASEYKTADGPITDTYWFVQWAVTGTNTPRFAFVLGFGIQ